tara:strand:+ start:279 stop:461 length:183 start_codon:yes stop_codon:yes gene_type:complete
MCGISDFFYKYKNQNLLLLSDRLGMRHGVENKSLFLDHALIEYAISKTNWNYEFSNQKDY